MRIGFGGIGAYKFSLDTWSFIHSFTNSFNKNVLNACYVSGIVAGPRDAAICNLMSKFSVS